MLSDIKSENNQEQSEQIAFTKENVRQIWNDYTKSLEISTTRTSLEYVEIELSNDAIEVFVPNKVSREYILQEKPLIEEVRIKLNRPDLALKLVVAASRFPDFKTVEQKKVLSDGDKYNLMVDKNPHIASLFKKFSLKADK